MFIMPKKTRQVKLLYIIKRNVFLVKLQIQASTNCKPVLGYHVFRHKRSQHEHAHHVEYVYAVKVNDLEWYYGT